ncbi:hypothetical protein C7999DRAFT_43888 [Corynascus novoguineensis]|uniref:Uncharacterized protein n=1 Tax=Corynascus novoguineensis TaxID=1126955 RepID=A0AAN7CLV4_9PEZI|nr:hypothetical protein C7999DRAFT_43888 [Corynascus novoguineensis]
MAGVMSRPTSPSSASAPSASTIATSVGSEQDDETPTVQFTNVRDLFQALDYVSGDILTVTNVSPSNFVDIERERERRGRRVRFRRYLADSRILIITIPTTVHEALHLALYTGRYIGQLVQKGLYESWESIGSATFRVRGHPRGDGGEGDSSGCPIPERAGPDNWPTLVIEAGVSESLDQLHADMRWWFSASNHDVKIVILAKFDHRQHNIILERWEEEGGMLEPVRRQEITISRDRTTDPISYHVTRGPLVLGFKLLFLRDPDPEEGEGDFVISIPDLQWYAHRVWTRVRD